MPNNSAKHEENKGNVDTYLLVFKVDGQKTFRVENCGRSLDVVQKKFAELKPHLKITEQRLLKVDGLTGEPAMLKLPNQ